MRMLSRRLALSWCSGGCATVKMPRRLAAMSSAVMSARRSPAARRAGSECSLSSLPGPRPCPRARRRPRGHRPARDRDGACRMGTRRPGRAHHHHRRPGRRKSRPPTAPTPPTPSTTSPSSLPQASRDPHRGELPVEQIRAAVELQAGRHVDPPASSWISADVSTIAAIVPGACRAGQRTWRRSARSKGVCLMSDRGRAATLFQCSRRPFPASPPSRPVLRSSRDRPPRSVPPRTPPRRFKTV
jgi:hypothetical protein